MNFQQISDALGTPVHNFQQLSDVLGEEVHNFQQAQDVLARKEEKGALAPKKKRGGFFSKESE